MSESAPTQSALSPESAGEPTLDAPARNLDPARVEQLQAEIRTADSNSILFFGSRVQERLTELSNRMLDGVLNEDVGAAGRALGEIVTAIRGFDVDSLDPNREQGLFARLFARGKPLQQFLHGYEETRKRLDAIAVSLERHKTRLLTNVASLDRLYAANQEHFQELELYIAAGDASLRRLEEEIPALEGAAAGPEDSLQSQQLRDLRNARNELERRLHDLRLSRQVSLQGLPSIRLVQDNNKDLVSKIDSALANTLPLWRQQLALVITIFRSGKTAQAAQRTGQLDRELATENAGNLQAIGAQVRDQIEHGVYDMGVVRQANQALAAGIEAGLQAAEEGDQARAQAANRLQAMESELRQALPTTDR